MAVSGHGV